MEEKYTYDEMKELAIKYLEKLKIYKPYINGFKSKEQKICMFERFAGYWVYQYPSLAEKIKQVEEEYGCLVYAVTHEYMEFGECYSMLCVSPYKEDEGWNVEEGPDGKFGVWSYVWNFDYDEQCSEFGTIIVKSAFGGLARIQ